MDRGAQRAKRMATDRLTRATKALGAGLGTVVLAPATTAMVVVKLTAAN
jgi:hypothetical protein